MRAIPPVLLLALVCAAAPALGAEAGARVAPPQPLPATTPLIVDKIVAFVENRPITLSEVELEVRLDRASAGDVTAAMGVVDVGDAAEMLQILVDRTAILRAMRSHYSDALKGDAADKELERMRRAFGGTDEWRAFLECIELSEQEVRERRRRALEAQAILEMRLEDIPQSIRREDIDDYLVANPEVRTREEAEQRMRRALLSDVRRRILEEARLETSTRVVDSIIPAPAASRTDAGEP